MKTKTYKDILSELEQRRTRAEYEAAIRMKEITEAIPELQVIEGAVADAAMVLFQDKVKAMDPQEAEKKYQQTTAVLSEKRKALLEGLGYSEESLKPQYVCQDCKDTGFLDDQKCHCLKQMISDAYLARYDLGDMIREQTFETFNEDVFSAENQNYASVYRKLGNKICNTFDADSDNYIFIGEPGRGKTFLCSCIANRLMEMGKLVIYLSAQQLVDLARKHAVQNKKDSDVDLYEDLKHCDLLIIDDLGTEHQTDFSDAVLFAIVNDRLLLHQKTIISTNLNITDIAERYAPRLASRLGGCYIRVPFKGADLRNQVNKK